MSIFGLGKKRPRIVPDQETPKDPDSDLLRLLELLEYSRFGIIIDDYSGIGSEELREILIRLWDRVDFDYRKRDALAAAHEKTCGATLDGTAFCCTLAQGHPGDICVDEESHQHVTWRRPE